MDRLLYVFTVCLIALPAGAQRASSTFEAGSTAGMGPGMRLHPAWGARVYANDAFAYHPRDFGQCRAVGTGEGGAGEGGGSIVICGVKTGEVVALSGATGARLWSFHTRGAVRARPWVGDVAGEGAGTVGRQRGQVFVGSADGCLYRLEVGTGKPSWEKPFCTDAAVDGDPVVVEGVGGRGEPVVLFTVGINKVYAVEAGGGAFRWEYHRDRPQFMSSEGVSSPTIMGGKVFVGFSDGALVALDVEGGRVAWEASLGEARQGATDVDATPVVDEDRVYSASFSRGPVAVTADDGRVAWQGSWFGASRPAVAGAWLVFGTADGEVVGVRKADGTSVFRTRLQGPGAAYAPVVVRGWIVAGYDGGLVLLDGADGAPVERLGIPMGTFAAPEVQGNRLFFVGSGGTVNAVDVLPR